MPCPYARSSRPLAAKLQPLWRAGGADGAGAGAGTAAQEHNDDGEGPAADERRRNEAQGRGTKRGQDLRLDLTTGPGAATADGRAPSTPATHDFHTRKRARDQRDAEVAAQLDAVLWGAVQRLAEDWAQRPERARKAAWGGEGGAGQGEQHGGWFGRPVVPSDGRTTGWGAEARKVDVAQLAWGLVRTGVGVEVGVGDARSAGEVQQAWQRREREGEGEGRKAQEAAWAWLAARAGDVVWRGEAREVANVVWAFAAARRWARDRRNRKQAGVTGTESSGACGTGVWGTAWGRGWRAR